MLQLPVTTAYFLPPIGGWHSDIIANPKYLHGKIGAVSEFSFRRSSYQFGNGILYVKKDDGKVIPIELSNVQINIAQDFIGHRERIDAFALGASQKTISGKLKWL